MVWGLGFGVWNLAEAGVANALLIVVDVKGIELVGFSLGFRV